AEEDRRRRDLIEARNTADSALYAAEQSLREFGDKVPASVVENARAAMEQVRKAKEGEDAQAIRASVSALNQAVQQIGISFYQQPSSDSSGQFGSHSSSETSSSE
ncbi:MAG: Hsp70 family protein, partial [Anaerolineales bacterium]|nr:Hsp70 family protein [Anaerolineales bacterium]